MSNFVYDNGSLPFPKADLVPVPSGADLTKYVKATDWNAVCQAVKDTQSVLRGAEWIGFTAGTDPAPAGIANYLWFEGSALKYKTAGTTYALVAGNTTVTPGTYTLANITVDAQGRITAASSGIASGMSLYNNSVAVANTPHSGLNFAGGGVTVADQGGGVALVTINTSATGTVNRVSKFVGTNTLGDSAWTDDGSKSVYGSNVFSASTSTGFVGFNTNALTGGNPESRFNVVASGANDIMFSRWGGAPQVTFKRAGGTFAAPTALAASGGIVQFALNGYDGTAFSGNQLVEAWTAAENWAVGAHGTAWRLQNIPRGTTTPVPVMYIDSVGGQLIPWKGSVDPDPNVAITATHDLPWAWELVKNDALATVAGHEYGAALILSNGNVDTSGGAFEDYTLQLKTNRAVTAGTNTYTQTIFGINAADNTNNQINQAIEVEVGEGNWVYKLFLDGHTIQRSANGATDNYVMTWTPVAGVASGLSTLKAVSNGTFDTSASAIEALGMSASATGTKSLGANTLTNVAMSLTASGGDTNIALRFTGDLVANAVAGADGDVLTRVSGLPQWQSIAASGIMAGSGTVGRVAKFTGTNAIGDTEFTIIDTATSLTLGDDQASDAIIINGHINGTSTDDTNYALSYALLPVGGTTQTRAAIRGSMGGTWNVTAGNLTQYGVWGDASGTKSAGTNTLAMVGTRGNASGTADDTRGVFGSNSGSGILTYGVYGQCSGTGTTQRAVFGTATGAGGTNIGGDFTATGGTTANIALRTVSGDNYLNSISGNTGVGVSSGGTIPARLYASATSGNAFRGNVNATAATVDAIAVWGQMGGTFDTTSGALNAIAVQGIAQATRTTGANNLGNFGGYFTATGAQVNEAIRTDAGTVRLNRTSGNTQIGGNGTPTAQLTVTNTTNATGALFTTTSTATAQGLTGVNSTITGTSDTTSSALENLGYYSSVTSTRSTGANNLRNIAAHFTAGGAQVNMAIRTVDGDNYFNTNSGSVGIGVTSGGTLAGGKLRIENTIGAQAALKIVQTPVGSTSGSVGAIRLDNNGTYDTTSGGVSTMGVYAVVSATRSAGAGSLTNVALRGDATGGQTNRALQTDNGDVLLNASSGTTTIGFSTATASALNLSGTSSFTSSYAGSMNGAFQFTWTPAAGTATAIPAVKVLGNGTFDTTAGAIANYGVFSQVTATRSAGANNLTNVAGRFTATGGQVNTAFQTDNGDVLLNTASGNTTIGATTSGTIAKLTVTGMSNAQNGMVVTYNATAGTTSGLAGIRVNNSATLDTTAGTLTTSAFYASVTASRSAGSNNLQNVGYYSDVTGAQINIAFRSDNGSNYFNTLSGNTGFGYVSGAALPAMLGVTSSGRALDTVSTTGSTNANLFTWTPVASTTDSASAVRIQANGTFDTTAGALTTRAFTAIASSTRSAGANTLTNKAALFTASGAQFNVAIETLDGNNHLNTNSGGTGIGYAAGVALPAKLAVTSTSATGLGDFLLTTSGSTFGLNTVNVLNNGTFDTTASARDSRGLKIFVTSTRSAGANALTNTAAWLTASGAQVNRALQTDDGDVLLNSVSGTATIGFSNATTAALTVTGQAIFSFAGSSTSGVVHATNSATAAVSARSAGVFLRSGSSNTGSGDINNYGVRALITTTRNSGANNSINTGLYTDAVGGQINYALYTDNGNNVLNATSGSTTLSRAFLTPNIITPDVLANATYDDWSPTGIADAVVVRVTTGGLMPEPPGDTATVTGIVGQVAGRHLYIEYTGSDQLVLKHQDAGSTAANQFYLRDAVDATIGGSNDAVTARVIHFIGTGSYWLEIGRNF